VKEKKALNNKLKGKWKIPTGRMEKAETIKIAVEREVYEETRLKIQFEGVIYFRETYPALFDCSDIFFVCFCRCNDSKNQVIDLEIDDELSESKWFTKQEALDEMKNIADQRLIKFLLKIFPENLEKYTMEVEEFKFLDKFNMISHKPKIKF